MNISVFGVLLWLLLRPVPAPGVWDWQIVGVYETQETCERAKFEQPFLQGTMCVLMQEGIR